jgi:hypothetical protein
VSSPLTGTFDSVKGHNASLVRKMLEMAVFVAPASGPDITTITDETNALTIPAGYVSLGIMSKDEGATITPSIDVSEIGGYGYGQPIRRDTVSRTNQVAFTMIESKRATFEMYYGMDLSLEKAPATSGGNEINWNAPDRPDTKYWRVLCLGRDGQGSNAIYHAEFFPRCTLADVAEQTWNETDPLTWGVTLGVDTDSVAGTPQRTFWGGPGLSTEVIEAMGFTRAS